MKGNSTGSKSASRAIIFSRVSLSAAPLCGLFSTPLFGMFAQDFSSKSPAALKANGPSRTSTAGEYLRGIIRELVGDIITRLFHVPTRGARTKLPARDARALTCHAISTKSSGPIRAGTDEHRA